MEPKRLFVDMDGTLARFHDEIDYLERMYEQDFFANLIPFEQMVEGIRLFTQQHPETPVYICSSVLQSPYCVEEKNAWLNYYLPEIPEQQRIFTEMGRSKAEYIPGGVTKGDFLLDDYNRGLHMFRFDGGSAIKCRNNINQQGRGAHGGEQGYMWEGPMVHTEDTPALIAAELSQLMGLEYSLEQAAQSYHVHCTNSVSPASTNNLDRARCLACLRINGEMVYAAKDPRNRVWTEYFTNPFNALRYLGGDARAQEYKLRAFDGAEMWLSGYQLEAICQNAYGCLDFKQFMQADRMQLAEDAYLSKFHRNDTVVGFVCQLSPDNTRFCLTPYYDHESMQKRISRHTSNKEAYYAEYFVDPKPAKSLRKSFEHALNDALRRAKETQTNPTEKCPGLD